MFTVGIITASDKGAAGKREDLSGPKIQEILKRHPDFSVRETVIVPDLRPALEEAMKDMADRQKLNLILTTGGTGFSGRDVTPEATLAVIQRKTPGIPEAMRWYSLQITPRAMLSRAEAGIRDRTLIVNLPGSPRAVEETLEHILPSIRHGLEVLLGSASECARP